MQNDTPTSPASPARWCSRGLKKFNWTALKEDAAKMVADDSLSDNEIASALGITKRALEYWKATPQFSSRVTEIIEECRQEDVRYGGRRTHGRHTIRKAPVPRGWTRACLTKYGLTQSDYTALHEAQQGLCAICGRNKPLHVDHCHTSGKVRGLLCVRCNTSLGQFSHDPELLRAAAEYLLPHIPSDLDLP